MKLKIKHQSETDLERIFNLLSTFKETIMSAISDFATKQNAFFDRQDKAVADLQTDVKALQDTLAKLQATPGANTPKDQASLDDVQARASTIADKLNALDALVPPPVPAA